MKKLTAAVVVLLAMMSSAGCVIDDQANPSIPTVITFRFSAFDQMTRTAVALPLTVVTTVSGWAPRERTDLQTPADVVVDSRQYPQAARQTDMSATVTGATPGVLLSCTWTATTPSGDKSSADSRGGEGASQVNGTSTTVTCKFEA